MYALWASIAPHFGRCRSVLHFELHDGLFALDLDRQLRPLASLPGGQFIRFARSLDRQRVLISLHALLALALECCSLFGGLATLLGDHTVDHR
jgi:hypothetical protein